MAKKYADKAFLLHQRVFSNTSTIGIWFSLHHGIFHCVNKGARTRAIHAYALWWLHWQGGEQNLAHSFSSEVLDSYAVRPKNAIVVAYVQELLITLLPQGFIAPEVWRCYDCVLKRTEETISRKSKDILQLEYTLLKTLGFSLEFPVDVTESEFWQFQKGQVFVPTTQKYDKWTQNEILQAALCIAGEETPQGASIVRIILDKAFVQLLPKPLQSRKLLSED